MTWEHYAALAALVLVLVLAMGVAVWVKGNRQIDDILAQFDAKTAEPEPEPVVSTLPEVDPFGWSAQRYSPWATWLHCIELSADPDAWAAAMDARRTAGERAWAARILRDADASPILAELMAAGLAAIEPAPKRELVAS